MNEKPLDKEEIESNISKLNGWKVIENHHITKDFIFENFKKSIEFINKIAAISEKENHHPDILLHGYKKVNIKLFTHSFNGLSDKDFKVATEIDKILK